MRIDKYDIFAFRQELEEKLANCKELLYTADDILSDACKAYRNLENTYSTMPEDEYIDKERELSDNVDNASNDFHKLESIVDSMQKALEYAKNLELEVAFLEAEGIN